MSYKITVEVPDNTKKIVLKCFDENEGEVMQLNKNVYSDNYGCSCGSKDDHHTVDCYLGVETKEAG